MSILGPASDAQVQDLSGPDYARYRAEGKGAKCRVGRASTKVQRLLNQKRNDTHKLCSANAPEVECIAKGKAGKRYECGNKVVLEVTSRRNWIVGALAC